jgi:phosphoserine phosphatase
MSMDRSAAEKVVRKDLDESTGIGKPISSRARMSQRTVEAYLKAGVRPRWMERIAEIDNAIKHQKQRLGRSYRALREECAGDRALFAERWTAFAQRCRFDELNELIEQHNEWYPIERDLPMDLRTRDYVLINGRSYRRQPLSAEWVLQEFPPSY